MIRELLVNFNSFYSHISLSWIIRVGCLCDQGELVGCIVGEAMMENEIDTSKFETCYISCTYNTNIMSVAYVYQYLKSILWLFYIYF